MFCKRCRQRTRKTEEKLSIIFSTIKLIESLFFEKDTYAMQATNPQNRNQNFICFFYFQTNQKLPGVVDIGFADPFTVECLDPLALSN